MTPAEAKSIRDSVGGTKRMIELLEATNRAVRYMCQRGVKRQKLAREIRRLEKAGKHAR